MDINDVLKLVNAGFTAEQIAALTSSSKETKDTPQDPAPAPEEIKKEDAAPGKEGVDLSETEKQIDSLISKKIKELDDKLSQLQTNAAMFTQQPGSSGGEPSFDDVMASILDPSGSPLKKG